MRPRRQPPPERAARGRPGGFGPTRSRHGERVRGDLRRGTGGHLPAPRRQALLLTVAAAPLGVVSLRRLALIHHLPEPALSFLDAGGVLTAEQISRHRKPCSWRVVAVLAQVAALPLGLPEAREALLRPRR